MIVYYSPITEALSLFMVLMTFALALALFTFPMWLPGLLEYLAERRRDQREARRRDELHQAQVEALRSQAAPVEPGRVVVEVVHHLASPQSPALPVVRTDGAGNQWAEVAPGQWRVVKPAGTAIQRRR